MSGRLLGHGRSPGNIRYGRRTVEGRCASCRWCTRKHNIHTLIGPSRRRRSLRRWTPPRAPDAMQPLSFLQLIDGSLVLQLDFPTRLGRGMRIKLQVGAVRGCAGSAHIRVEGRAQSLFELHIRGWAGEGVRPPRVVPLICYTISAEDELSKV